ncbi:hypothetical protein HDU89_003699 [Geranomyces variabilis]|nr:hypothetical protein HDU89_003699 [Geranomyces variabilis]
MFLSQNQRGKLVTRLAAGFFATLFLLFLLKKQDSNFELTCDVPASKRVDAIAGLNMGRAWSTPASAFREQLGCTRYLETGRKVYNVIVVNDEIDLLQLHIRELASTVDKFVLVESDTSFSGLPKKMHVKANMHKFCDIQDQITLIKCDLSAVQKGGFENLNWAREGASRDCGAQGLTDAADDDLIILSDLDEVPKPHFVSALKFCDKLPELVGSRGSRYYLSFRFYDLKYPQWDGPLVFAYSYLKSGHAMSAARERRASAGVMVSDSHWHSSWCFLSDNPAQFLSKIRHWSEQERGEKPPTEDLEDLAKHLTDCHLDSPRCKLVPNTDDLPAYLLLNAQEFRNHMPVSVST